MNTTFKDWRAEVEGVVWGIRSLTIRKAMNSEYFIRIRDCQQQCQACGKLTEDYIIAVLTREGHEYTLTTCDQCSSVSRTEDGYVYRAKFPAIPPSTLGKHIDTFA